jgi:hypothetical protein
VRVTITKKERRNQLTCWRADGSCENADLGPSLPHHDLAHFVVERKLNLVDGFFGRIASGYSVAQLSDKETIQNSPPESLAAEVAARALQSLSSGACRQDQIAELVNAELSKWRAPTMEISPEQTASMLAEFQELTNRYATLRVGETMQLEFPRESAANKRLQPIGRENAPSG